MNVDHTLVFLTGYKILGFLKALHRIVLEILEYNILMTSLFICAISTHLRELYNQGTDTW